MAGDDMIWLPVAPSFRGFGAQMVKEATGAARQAGGQMNAELAKSGKQAGQAAGKGVADGVRASAQQIEKASTAVAQARKKESDAAANVLQAEARLEESRRKGAGSEQIARQEATLEQHRRRQESAARQLSAAEQDVQSIRDGGTGRAQAVVRAENQVEKARLDSAKAADDVALAEAKVTELHYKGEQSASKVAKAQADLVKARSAQESAVDTLRAKEGLYAATLEDVEQQSKQAADATDQAGRSADEAGGFMSSAADKAKALAIGLGAAAAAGLKMGADVVGEIDRMNAQLGLTGEAAQQLGGEVGQVLRSGLAGSAEDAAGAVGALTAQFSYLGAEGEKTAAELSRNFLAFTDTFGVSMEETTQTVGQLVANGLAADVTEGIDLLTASFQRVPAAMRDELPEIINEYGTNFRSLGFTGEEAFGLLVSAADKGKWALDKTGDSLKEFTIRGSDMSKASTEAYDALGLSAEEMSRKLTEGGPAARDALNQTAQALLNMENPADRANTAIALFGTPLEDLSVDQIPQFLEGLTGADAAMAGFAGSSEELAQGIEDSLSGRLNAAKGVLLDLAGNAFMVAWDAAQRGVDIFREYQPLITGVTIVLGALTLGMTAYSVAQSAAAAGGFLAFMKTLTVVTRAQAAAQFLLNTAMWTSPITWIVAGIAALVAGLVYFFTQTETGKQVWDTLVQAFTTGWEWVKNAFATAWEFIQPVLSGIWEGIKFVGAVFGTILLGTALVAWNLFSAAIQFVWNSIIKPVWDAFAFVIQWLWTSVLQPVWGAMQIGFQALGDFFSWVWNSIIKPAWDALGAGISWVWTNVVSPVWERFKNGLTVLGGFFQTTWNSVIKPVWDALGAGIRTVIDSVIKPAFDGMKSALQSVGDFFRTVVDGIRSVWDQLKGHVARPINFVIDTVWNNGLVEAWNTIAGFLPGLPDAKRLRPVAFAEGGPVPMMPGATRGKDSVHALMMPNEHVWDVANVDNAGGHGEVYKMRGMIDAGIPFTWVDGRVVPAGHGLEPQRFAEGGAVGARLDPSPGEGGLKPIAILAKRLIHRIWPSIDTIGGYRQDAYPEHPSGRALDVMVGVGNPIGDEVTSWALANDHILPLIHALWKQTVWMPGGATQPMGDRGNPTQNHMDHPHLWYHPKDVDPNVVPDGLVGHDGLTRDDRLGVIKEKISEILDKALDPIREGMSRVLGDPPPELLGIPPIALDRTKEAAVDGAFSFAENIAGDLKEVYNQAKDVVTSITGLFRDEGGYIPAGKSIVNNETGKPEAVFNWRQVEQIGQILASVRDLDHLWAVLGELGNLAVTGDYTDRLREATGLQGDDELVDAIVSMRERFNTGIEDLQASMSKVVQAAGVKAATGYRDEVLDFFGFKGLFDDVSSLMSPPVQQQAATTSPASATTSGITGTVSGADTGLVYGDPNLTYETQQVELETKMPALSESGVAGSGPVADQVKEAFAVHGWDTGEQWAAVDWIINKESSWNPTAQNPTSTAYGLFQFLDTTWSTVGATKTDNPKLQAEAGAAYIKQRYGDPLGAKRFWEANNWYDQGGWLMPGLTMAMNGTGQPEAILTADQWDRFDNLLVSLPSAAQFERIASLADADTGDVPAPRAAGPLLHIENLVARDEDEAMRAAAREARRLTRSSALVGGWRA